MDAKTQYIRTKKIKQLYLNSSIPAVLSGIMGLFLVAALWESANHQLLMQWFSITLLLGIIRITLITSFKKRNPKKEQLLKWEMPYALSLLVIILNWSIGLLFIMPKDNLSAMFIVSTFSVGLAAAATSWYGQIRYMQLGTVCLVLIPTIFTLLSYGVPETLWVGIAGCFIFLAFLLTSAFFQKTLNESLALAYDLEQSIKKAETIAFTDVLTGLNNRRAFFEIAPKTIKHCFTKNLPISMITFDIDFFKKINDTFGHAAGDIALQRIASLLRKNVRSSDVCCRLGGEEFAILLPNVHLEKAMRIAEKFRATIAAMPIVLSREKSISVTASFGVCDTGNTIDEMLNHADQAMYRAKRNGRNLSVAYSADLSKPLSKPKARPENV